MDQHRDPRLLLAVVRGRWEDFRAIVGQGPPPGAGFAEQCRESDVHPWVHERLTREDRWGAFAPPAREILQRARLKVRNDNMLLLAAAERALDRLAEAGIEPVVLKGLDLVHRLYDGFDQRTMDDVDLLVAIDQVVPALDALEAAGWTLPEEPARTHYIRSSHHLPLRSPGPLPVDFEIHWNLAQEGRYAVDVDGILSRAQPIEIAGRRALRMEDHDIVAHLLLHHFSHYFDRRLKWLLDLRTVSALDGFDWARVVERIRGWGAATAAGISAAHLHKLDPELIPDEARRELRVALLRRALVAPLRSSHPLELFRNTRKRAIQLYLAATMLERPSRLPAWLLHRRTRDRRPGHNPLDRPDRRPAAPAGDASRRRSKP